MQLNGGRHMIGYAMLGSNNLERSYAFYDVLLGVVGGKRAMDLGGRGSLYMGANGGPMLGVVEPHNKEPASAGNGTMVALACKDHDEVAALHAKAMELGAPCEGPPGPRGPEAFGFFGAYFRDPDGNKLAAFHWKPAKA